MKPEPKGTGSAAAVPPGTDPKLRYTPKPKGAWKKLIGRAKHDNLSPEAYRLGAEWRARMNRAGR